MFQHKYLKYFWTVNRQYTVTHQPILFSLHLIERSWNGKQKQQALNCKTVMHLTVTDNHPWDIVTDQPSRQAEQPARERHAPGPASLKLVWVAQLAAGSLLGVIYIT